ncbi:G5 domain-containing protein [Niallia nealsonii]|uniref:G5 domain-containing protein n=1 Tax=Niallia nealsonii TaxID=115979 RepID=A0A2N0YWQ3_9BACI|nr:G5 domain-containing protein [Niallia nealsonii]PKG21683.1 hypothetical protein CWS01_21170 [Niallia nealsonii]
MKLLSGTKIFIGLFLATFIIFSFTHLGALAYQKITKEKTYKANTMVAAINISGLTKRAAKELVEMRFKEWQTNKEFSLQYKEKTVQFSPSLLTLNVSNTLDNIKEGQTNDLLLSINKVVLQTELAKFKSLPITSLQENQLFADVVEEGQTLDKKTSSYSLVDYLSEGELGKEVLAKTEIPIASNELEVEKTLAEMGKIDILPSSSFSLLKMLEDLEQQSISEDTASLIAAGIYGVVLPTNFAVTERNIGNALPTNVKPGYEAKASVAEKMDLSFTNSNQKSYQIQFKVKDNTLYVELKGETFASLYKVYTENKKELEPKTVIQFDSSLKKGEVKVINKGKNGLTIDVIKETLSSKGEVLKREVVANDYYPPDFRIEAQYLPNEEDEDSTDESSTQVSTEEEATAEEQTTELETEAEQAAKTAEEDQHDLSEDEIVNENEFMDVK